MQKIYLVRVAIWNVRTEISGYETEFRQKAYSGAEQREKIAGLKAKIDKLEGPRRICRGRCRN